MRQSSSRRSDRTGEQGWGLRCCKDVKLRALRFDAIIRFASSIQEHVVRDLASTCDVSLFDSSKILGIRCPSPDRNNGLIETDHGSKTFAICMKIVEQRISTA